MKTLIEARVSSAQAQKHDQYVIYVLHIHCEQFFKVAVRRKLQFWIVYV